MRVREVLEKIETEGCNLVATRGATDSISTRNPEQYSEAGRT